MKVAYGIMGEGRGHAARLLTIGPKLNAELLIFAGGDAYKFLKSIDLGIFGGPVEVVEIPTFGFRYQGSKISLLATSLASLPKLLDLKLHKVPFLKLGIIAQNTKKIEERINDFGPSIIVSDGEPYTSHIRRKVPLLSFDRFAKMAFCKSSVATTKNHKFKKWVSINTYKQLLANPDYIITSSFYDAVPKKGMEQKMLSLGPIFRKEVLDETPVEGDHVVVYATNPYIYTDAFFKTLNNIDRKVFCYGSGREGQLGNIVFCSLAPTDFAEHIRTCAYVISTPGNMLLSELRYLQKRVLLVKTDSLEQRENILYAAKMGFGSQISFEKVFSQEEVENQVSQLKPSEPVADHADEVVNKILSFAR